MSIFIIHFLFQMMTTPLSVLSCFTDFLLLPQLIACNKCNKVIRQLIDGNKLEIKIDKNSHYGPGMAKK